ncbi:TetR/AcrR family transcriptional regulator [Rhodococcus sp. HNM0569]|uniref:TetR/AcrR family transcriptional regulator n=1 Tax=Rhodococcus sp. HNM0569 TaxID=2716340 RepID=UPI00146E88F2|nr:TetR/AcrR family transcriptional regulator [Rhodococcus sp. HNM0569]NLU83766.1 TetR/AcrR family transcriptional regulator [Rhodococcus sp. HNM0569]
MARPLDLDKRRELLRGALDYIATHGLADLSLRPLATALGTSSRMLVHYFGTKEELLVQALELQHPDMKRRFDQVKDAEEIRYALGKLWNSMTTGEDTVSTRVLLQVMAMAFTRPEPFARFANAAFDTISTALRDALVRAGSESPEALVDATIAAATFRGLLLDRLVTGDVERVDNAAHAFIRSVAR